MINRLLIIGNPEEHHVGAHFLSAAKGLGLETRLMDIRESQSKNIWVNRVFHRGFNHQPAYLNRFSQRLVAICRELKPQMLLVTGISAPHAAALQQIGQMGIHRANYLTDDPWNPKNAAGFFWPALREYDVIFSPRRANLEDLRRHGCRRVEYLPFGYNPEQHFPEAPATPDERERFACEVAFVGGADADRLPLARALVRAGLQVKLYGGYWERDQELRPHWHGFVHGRELRLAVSGATVNICVGRKANRDGHAMRSLELPAMAAGLVVEDTPEHRELFGPDGECVVYFSSVVEMVAKTRELCQNPPRTRALVDRVFARIVRQGRHTYADRLAQIVQTVQALK